MIHSLKSEEAVRFSPRAFLALSCRSRLKSEESVRFSPPPQPSPASGRGSHPSCKYLRREEAKLPLPLAGEGWGGGEKLCVLFAFALQVLATPAFAQNAPQVLAPPIVEPIPPPIPVLEPRPFAWRELAFDGPNSIKIYDGDAVNQDGQPVRAWYAAIDYNDEALQARAILSHAKLGREPASALAQKNAALLAINGGYFDVKSVPSKTYSLVLSEGQILATNIIAATRPNGRFLLTRGAFGIRADRTFDIAWVAHFDNRIVAFQTPTPNTYAKPAPAPRAEDGRVWDAMEAIGGAPILIKDGEIRISNEAEAIPLDMTTVRHPRTAIGWSGGRRLTFFVCDGRQPLWSMGQTLPELADTLRDLGCVEALNLDGGGSSTFVVDGRALNRPGDGRERNVSSIFAIVKK